VTPAQLEPSAQAPCTRTIVGFGSDVGDATADGAAAVMPMALATAAVAIAIFALAFIFLFQW
jgi:hypothetical protein